MREPIVIRGGRLVRPAGVSDADWARSLGRHRRSRRWVRAHKLAYCTYDLMHALLGDVDVIDDRRVADTRAVALAALLAAEHSRFAATHEMQEPIRRLRERLSRYIDAGYSDPSGVLDGLVPVKKRPDGNFVPGTQE